jgi:hypothetical protein
MNSDTGNVSVMLMSIYHAFFLSLEQVLVVLQISVGGEQDLEHAYGGYG